MIFQAVYVHEVQVSSIWEKKIYMKDNRIRTHDLDGPIYAKN